MKNALDIVSVVVPAYNGERTILKTLQSVINQNCRHLQLIVVDDASTDSTCSLVKSFMKEKLCADRFKLVSHGINMGLSKTLNDGLREAIGDYVLILHQDCELMGKDWIERAMKIIADKNVAVVTGYYGISDEEDDSFVKRAFGVLRKQFHSRPKVVCEEATFSEGKCDLYKKSLLLEIGAFPTNYRIAGEDLIVSYKLRSLGYKIIKSFDLCVVQRFGGAAESLSGNVGKEFLFGKVMGGVFSEFKLFLFKSVKSSNYSGERSLHRASQPAFVLTIFIVGIASLFVGWMIYLLFGLLLVRCIYYFFRVLSELEVYRNPISHPILETLAITLLGILTDFAYSFGFAYGIVRYSLVRRL